MKTKIKNQPKKQYILTGLLLLFTNAAYLIAQNFHNAETNSAFDNNVELTEIMLSFTGDHSLNDTLIKPLTLH